MKKTAFALATIMFCTIVICPTIGVVYANIIPYPDTPSTELPTLVIRSPKNYSDYYADNTFRLDFVIIEPESWGLYYKFFPIVGEYYLSVYLDGVRSILQLQRFPRSNTVSDYTAIFTNLTDTEHVVHIVVEARAYYMAYYTKNGETISTGRTNNTYITQTIHFQIDPNSKTVLFQKDPQRVSKDPYPNPPTPVPVIISPQNTSYIVANVTQFTLPLDFTINATASWIGYSLDNQSRITVGGNSTLSKLSAGSHNITLFAMDIFGNMGTSDTVHFTLTEQVAPSPNFQPILLALPITAIFSVVALLIYSKKRKHYC